MPLGERVWSAVCDYQSVFCSTVSAAAAAAAAGAEELSTLVSK
jgi:hypothetical protein